MQRIVENHTHKSGNYHEKGTLKNGTTPYHRQVKLPPRATADGLISNQDFWKLV